jgi:predicted SnoaL-like aldol condensation-catalyzing enzyme
LSDSPRGEAVVDSYRLENGKVVEHWDVIQPIPETAADDKRGGRGLVDRQA